jgi:uncharacterized protein affecting Mg2+/Co2+ transport
MYIYTVSVMVKIGITSNKKNSNTENTSQAVLFTVSIENDFRALRLLLRHAYNISERNSNSNRVRETWKKIGR